MALSIETCPADRGLRNQSGFVPDLSQDEARQSGGPPVARRVKKKLGYQRFRHKMFLLHPSLVSRENVLIYDPGFRYVALDPVGYAGEHCAVWFCGTGG